MEHFMAILWASLAILGVLFLDSFVGFSKLLAGVSI